MNDKDIRPYNDKHQRHGLWEIYYSLNGQLMYKVNYVNGKSVGYGGYYWSNGKLVEKTYYL